MRTMVAVVALFVLLAAGAAYFYFTGKEYEIVLTEQQIGDKLAARLPITKTYLLIVELTLSNPRVNLKNGSNVITAGLDAALNITLDKSREPLGGTIDASAGIAYVKDKGEFYLVDPKIERLKIQGISDKIQPKVNDAVSEALVEYFATHPIYSLHNSNLKQAAARAVLKRVVIENKEVVITLGI